MSTAVRNRHQPRAGRQMSRARRRGGNVGSILINAVLIFLLDAHPGWRSVPFLTPATTQVVGLVTLTLAAGLAANVMYFLADPPRLHAFGDLVTLAISLVTTVRVWQVFPFAFHGSMAFWSAIVRAILIIGIVGACIGLLYSLVILVRGKPIAGVGDPPYLRRDDPFSLDLEEGTPERADNDRALLDSKAPALHRRCPAGASVDRLHIRHMARSSDRHHPIHRIQDICTGRGSGTGKDLRHLLG